MLHKIANRIFDIIPKTLNVQNEVNFTFMFCMEKNQFKNFHIIFQYGAYV